MSATQTIDLAYCSNCGGHGNFDTGGDYLDRCGECEGTGRTPRNKLSKSDTTHNPSRSKRPAAFTDIAEQREVMIGLAYDCLSAEEIQARCLTLTFSEVWGALLSLYNRGQINANGFGNWYVI